MLWSHGSAADTAIRSHRRRGLPPDANEDFFSFGTIDLTQTALGCSRDDIERWTLARCAEMKVFDGSPFERLDTPGVGQVVRIGRLAGRKVNLAVCAEHRGNPTRSPSSANSGVDCAS